LLPRGTLCSWERDGRNDRRKERSRGIEDEKSGKISFSNVVYRLMPMFANIYQCNEELETQTNYFRYNCYFYDMPTTHTHTIVLLLFWNLSGTTRVSRYQEGKTNLDLLEQEIVSGSGICWAICKSAPHPR